MSDAYASPGDAPERDPNPPSDVMSAFDEHAECPKCGFTHSVECNAVACDTSVPDDRTRIERTPWRFRDHEGRGEILTMLEGPENDPVAPAGWPEAQKRALDEAFDAGFRCGTDVHRCELREARAVRDAIAATRAFRLQVSIVVAICVVVLCSTLLIVKG